VTQKLLYLSWLTGALVVIGAAPALAQTASADPPVTTGPTQFAAASPLVADNEIIVTAQKLKDVPVPVSVISAAALATTNQVLVRDYATLVPALAITPVIGSEQSLSIRGITTGGQSIPTVGILVDDIPFGDSTRIYIPEFDPGDLARIEVLRGPQGTLYGANSLGGLLKYDTIQPSSKGTFGTVAGGIGGLQNGNRVGYNVRGALNVPISDDVALRVSAFDRKESGYITNELLGRRGINEANVYGGRAALKFDPAPNLSIVLRALYQRTRENGSSDVNLGLGDLTQNEVVGAGVTTTILQAYSATVKARLGKVDFTSLTGYSVNQTNNRNDLSSRFSGITQRLYGASGALLNFPSQSRKFSEELRGSVTVLHNLDATVGLYYTRENISDQSFFQATDPLTGAVAQNYIRYHDPLSTYTEYAAFGDLDYHFTDRIDIQVGVRGGQIKNNFAPYTQPPRFGYRGQPGIKLDIIDGIKVNASPVNYLVTPRYRVSDNAMLYFRFATGYRPGGANPGSPSGVPLQYGPDQTKNYELGAKADFFDRKLTFDASVYYIDWSEIQIQLQLPVCADLNLCPNAGQLYEGNGGSAKSEGVELSAALKPTRALTLSGWFAYNNAVLTQNFPAGTFGLTGDRLPFSSRVSWHLSADQNIAITKTMVATFGGDLSFVGDRIGIFQGVADNGTYPARSKFPSYYLANIRASIADGNWTVSTYINNLLDKRALIGDGGTFQPTVLFYNKPRSFGIILSRSF